MINPAGFMGKYSGHDGQADFISSVCNCLHLKIYLFIFSPEKHLTGIQG
jgi:hypothetical protein